MKSFATTLTPEQLPFVVSRIANAGVRRMIEERGTSETLKAILADDKQHRTLLRIIDEEFGQLPGLTDMKVGSWVQFTEPKHHRIVIGKVKSVTAKGVKVQEYNDMGSRLGWASTGNEWTVLPDLSNGFMQVAPKLTVEQREANKTTKVDGAKKKQRAKTEVKAPEQVATPPAPVIEALQEETAAAVNS